MEYLVQEETLSAIADKIREKAGTEGEIVPEAMAQGVEDAYAAGVAVGDAEIQQIDRRMDGLLIAEDVLINGDPTINLFNESLFAEDSGEYGNLSWSNGTVGYAGPPGQFTNFTIRDYAPGLTIGKTYTFSYDGSRGDVWFEGRGLSSGNPVTFVLTEDIYNARLYFYPSGTNDIGDYVCYVSQIMLNVGAQASPYVPYASAFSLRSGAAAVLSKIDTAEENLPLVRAAGKEEGHREGYDEGHTAGFNEGQSYGYSEGYGVGQEAGYQSGKQDGYSEGYDYGYFDGYSWGYESGYSQGYQEGVEATRPIGTLSITKNGTHDVESYQRAEVDVPIPDEYLKPEGTLNVTENGEYDVKKYAKVKVETPVAPPWTEVRTDIAVATRSNWNYIAASGEYLSLPQLSASNKEAAIGTTTANSFEFTDRESKPIYIMPVNKRASSVTIHNTDGKPHTCLFVGLVESNGTFSVAFDSGKIASNTYKFVAGSITHILMSMERTDGSNFEWGYNDAQVSVEFTGVADAMDEFWDDFQNKGARTHYEAALSGFPATQFYPRYDINIVDAGTWMFTHWGTAAMGYQRHPTDLVARLEECGVSLDFSRATSTNYTFYDNYDITRLPELNLSSSLSNNYFCYYLSYAVEIGKVTGNVSATWSNAFRHTESLQHITFEPGTVGKSISFQHSSELTTASIESIIRGLSTSVSGQSCTINGTAINNYISSEGRDTWLSLIAERSNWSIVSG